MIQQQVEFFAAWFQSTFGVALTTERQEGQGLVEYALILVLISIAAIVAMGLLATQIKAVFTSVTSALTAG